MIRSPMNTPKRIARMSRGERRVNKKKTNFNCVGG
jgi:hypothetical protein